MKKRRINKIYSSMLAEKAMELANVVLGGIVFVQFVSGEERATVFVLGLVTFWVLHIFAYVTLRVGGDEK